MEPASPQSANLLFRQYWNATQSSRDSGELLSRLLEDHARPLVERVVRRRLAPGRGISPEDVEDVVNEALLSLMYRLREMRAGQPAPAVDDFEGYVVGLASHVAYQFFAVKFPERSRLRSRIRYVLSNDSRFRTHRAAHGTLLCGLAVAPDWTAATPAEVEQVRGALARLAIPARLPDLIFGILSESRGAIELGDLLTLAAGILGVEDRTENPDNLAETLADPGVSQERGLELRRSLESLWEEIRELPLAQRVCLLLNLRSASGACVWLLPELGIVAFRELAAALGMHAEELAELWNRLPLGDAEIAARLGLERQQIINMRSAARQRLTRREKIRNKSIGGVNMPEESATK